MVGAAVATVGATVVVAGDSVAAGETEAQPHRAAVKTAVAAASMVRRREGTFEPRQAAANWVTGAKAGKCPGL
jgi:hypothetical protein